MLLHFRTGTEVLLDLCAEIYRLLVVFHTTGGPGKKKLNILGWKFASLLGDKVAKVIRF